MVNQGCIIYLLSGNICTFHFQILNIIWKKFRLHSYFNTLDVLDNAYLRQTAKDASLGLSWLENINTRILHLDALKSKNELSSF